MTEEKLLRKKTTIIKQKGEMKTIRNQINIKALTQTFCQSIFPSLIIYSVKRFKEVLS